MNVRWIIQTSRRGKEGHSPLRELKAQKSSNELMRLGTQLAKAVILFASICVKE